MPGSTKGQRCENTEDQIVESEGNDSEHSVCDIHGEGHEREGESEGDRQEFFHFKVRLFRREILPSNVADIHSQGEGKTMLTGLQIRDSIETVPATTQPQPKSEALLMRLP